MPRQGSPPTGTSPPRTFTTEEIYASAEIAAGGRDDDRLTAFSLPPHIVKVTTSVVHGSEVTEYHSTNGVFSTDVNDPDLVPRGRRRPLKNRTEARALLYAARTGVTGIPVAQAANRWLLLTAKTARPRKTGPAIAHRRESHRARRARPGHRRVAASRAGPSGDDSGPADPEPERVRPDGVDRVDTKRAPGTRAESDTSDTSDTSDAVRDARTREAAIVGSDS